jgi:hypothetical protein
MHQILRLSIPALASLTLVACGDDPVSYSEPVTINLKAKSSETVNNVVADDKGITTENSNPYGSFVANARTALGGKDPSTIALDSTTLTLGAASTGVLGLGEVFTGNVEVNFTTNDTNNTYPAAWGALAATDGSGPITLTSGFDTADVSATDFTKILGGSFKVGIRGPAGANFATKGADADLQVTLTFTAFE